MSPSIVKLIESIVRYELDNILKEQIDGANINEPLYHVTYFNRLDGISAAGLQRGMTQSIGAPSYASHAAKGIFLTEEDGVKFWYSRAEDFANHNSDNPLEDGLAPVVLKIDPAAFLEEDLQVDELGSKDAFSDAYIVSNTIDPDYIDVWDGNNWIPVDDWERVDIEQAFDREEDDGEEYYTFKYNNPLSEF